MNSVEENVKRVGGGSVRRSGISAIGGRSPLLQFDAAEFEELSDALSVRRVAI